MQRGKDGHLTIGAASGGSDFFASAGARPANRSGGGAPPVPAAAPKVQEESVSVSATGMPAHGCACCVVTHVVVALGRGVDACKLNRLCCSAYSQLKKFANAKAISSRDFQDANGADAEAERRDRLNKFSGASAISSADYFGRADSRGGAGGMGPAGSGDLDISAADIVNRLSFQVGMHDGRRHGGDGSCGATTAVQQTARVCQVKQLKWLAYPV